MKEVEIQIKPLTHMALSQRQKLRSKKNLTQSELFFVGGSSTAGVSPILADNEAWPWITIK